MATILRTWRQHVLEAKRFQAARVDSPRQEQHRLTVGRRWWRRGSVEDDAAQHIERNVRVMLARVRDFVSRENHALATRGSSLDFHAKFFGAPLTPKIEWLAARHVLDRVPLGLEVLASTLHSPI